MKVKFTLLFLTSLLLVSCYKDEQEVDYDYENGQTLTVVPTVSVQKIDSVRYYWDDTPIATKKEMPFVLKYKIENQSSGSHILKYQVYSSTAYISTSQSTQTIRIK